jgi:hypothetical protein
LGVFWGLCRLADDGGRFMLVDLRGAEAATLADLVTLLAPFTTGVVVDAEPGRQVWRRHATTLFGRIEAAGDAAAVARAKRSAADAVLAPAPLAEAARSAEIARLGDDGAADLRLGDGDGMNWLAVTDGDASALEAAPAGCCGHLVRPTFWWEPVAGRDGDARRRVIADELAPRLQRLNAASADLPPAPWRGG